MIDKKSLKMNRLALLLFSVLTLICETTTSVKAQSSDKKMEVSTSHTCSATDAHNGMRAMFTFLRENIEYTSKAIDALNDKMHYNTFYFIEPDSEKTEIEYLTEQYAILNEEEEINNAYLEENRTPDEITQQSKKIKQKILLPAPLLDKKITPII